jgi:GT2 family glycosyltransferase
MSGRIAVDLCMMTIEGDWVKDSATKEKGGVFPMMVGCNMSFRRDVFKKAGGFDNCHRFHRGKDDACLRVLLSGFEIVHQRDAGVMDEAFEGSHKKDALRWYLRLRYLWGKNSAYLIRRDLGESIPFRRYAGSRFSHFFRKLRATSSKHEGSGFVETPLSPSPHSER